MAFFIYNALYINTIMHAHQYFQAHTKNTRLVETVIVTLILHFFRF